MGAKCLRGYGQQQIKEYRRQSFELKQIVGKGSFGKVWKVSDKRNGKTYALKVISKARVIVKKSVHSVLKERELLGRLHHPFITNMIGAFQDRQYLYLLIDFLDGGDLRQLFRNKDSFSEKETKFIIRSIMEALRYIHDNKIIHRDIKPQNIIFDKHGYCRVADMGISREWREQNSNETSGTPGYMAPQVLLHQNHSYQADYYAVGVIAYELLMGKRPYYGHSRRQIRDKVVSSREIITPEMAGISKQCADFINRLIQRNHKLRLGHKGIQQIFNHPWLNFSNNQQYMFQNKRIKSPFTNLYTPERIIKQDSMDQDQARQTGILLRNPNIQSKHKPIPDIFQGYQFTPQMYAELFLKSHIISIQNNEKDRKSSATLSTNQSPVKVSMRKVDSQNNILTRTPSVSRPPTVK